ncbi:hypothetical protein QA633_06775 [Bradyrhizobium barranii]|uniref:hypothetical protein n=1 Tax=Bradyrhizobium barranii TaxID=2992140 RepID=UPI0024B0DA59|nr:hypothetical protein [Bradyrhizobium barranii]WFT96800.1 hypothetical protein QA633_06775 [Bradyrhizobium barranii]
MRKIREVLRLKYCCGTNDRVISRSVGIGRPAIAEYVRRAAVIGHHLADTGGARRHRAGAQAVRAGRLQPAAVEAASGLGHVHAELRCRSVTLALLWEEYRGHHPDGYGYSRYVAARFMLPLLG